MSAQIVNFPGSNPDGDVRRATRIETPPEMPAKPTASTPKPPVYVRVRADAFQSMMLALSFYARQGWDGGGKARSAMDETFGDQPA